MIAEFSTSTPDSAPGVRFRLIGIGNAGVHLVDAFLLAGGTMDGCAINSDSHSLSASLAPVKVLLGSRAARGLGAGGDPEVGAAAVEESMSEVRAALEGADVIFLCAGLGGGTGSGALPLIANVAKLTGAMVVAFATMPFTFEGKRRARQARDAIEEVSKFADIVVCFENDRMSEITRPQSGVGETFAAADRVLCEALRTVVRMVSLPGPLRVGLAELRALLAGRDARCVLGAGSGQGSNRAFDAVAAALKNPLLNRGKPLAGSARVLVYLSAGPSLTLAEVGAIMGEVQKLCGENTLLSLGVGECEDEDDRLSVAILGCSMPKEAAIPVRSDDGVTATAEEKDVRTPSAPATRGGGSPGKGGRAAGPMKQEVLPLDLAARGRFEKSEPTIVEGEDLDVPTYLRLKIKLK